MSDAVDKPGCPQCGQPVSTTVATSERGEQLSLERIECPNCGSPLVRDVEGHADRGWRLDSSAAADGSVFGASGAG